MEMLSDLVHKHHEVWLQKGSTLESSLIYFYQHTCFVGLAKYDFWGPQKKRSWVVGALFHKQFIHTKLQHMSKRYSPVGTSHPRAKEKGTYNGYSLLEIPRNAWPGEGRHYGKHSYTISRGEAKLEALLQKRAFFVKSGSNKGQLTWSKYPSIKDAWLATCTRAGVLP